MKLFKYAIFFLFVSSMYPWFLWKIPTVVITVVVAMVAVLSMNKFKLSKSSNNTRFCVAISIMLLWMAIKYNLFGVITTLVSIYLVYVLCNLNDSFKKELLRFITNGFAIILAISIPFYLLNFVGLPLPHSKIVFEDLGAGLENYYLFLKMGDGLRFQSIFLEPGHMTMGIAPLLFLNRYNIRDKAVLVLVIAQLMSMSIAGIIVMTVGLLFTELLRPSFVDKIKGAFTVLIAFGILVTIAYVFYGEEIIQTLILDRLQIKDGGLAGYNRTTLDVDELYYRVLASSNKWTGIDWDPLKYGSASGYRVYIITNGIIGAILAVFSYLMPWITRKKAAMLFFSIILLLLLLQNGYPQWWCMLISLVLGPAYYNYQQVSVVNKRVNN